MARVEITTAGHVITVDADEPLDAVAAKALELWHATRDPAIDRAWGVTGLVAERAEQVYVSGYDADLGRRG